MREDTANSTNPTAWFRVPARRMFKTKAAAQYLGLHPQTLRRLTDDGKLKALNLDGKRVYTLEELDRYIGSVG
jgi:excisionase family DNA binding protein